MGKIRLFLQILAGPDEKISKNLVSPKFSIGGTLIKQNFFGPLRGLDGMGVERGSFRACMYLELSWFFFG